MVGKMGLNMKLGLDVKISGIIMLDYNMNSLPVSHLNYVTNFHAPQRSQTNILPNVMFAMTWPHSKFQNPRTTPSGRKLAGKERKDIFFRHSMKNST